MASNILPVSSSRTLRNDIFLLRRDAMPVLRHHGTRGHAERSQLQDLLEIRLISLPRVLIHLHSAGAAWGSLPPYL